MPLTRKRKYSSYMSGARVGRMQSRYQKRAVQGVLKKARKAAFATVAHKVNNLYSMIETKESTQSVADNTNLTHNNIVYLSNPFTVSQGTGDPMAGTGNRIGDRITVKGSLLKGFVECSLSRPKIFVRIMLIKYAKGDDPTRATLFKGDSGNKMIDQVNTDRYTILAQKIINVQTSNNAPSTIGALTGQVTAGTAAGIGTRTFKIWVPGYKFGKGGNVQFEDSSGSQPKFFSYRWLCFAYDWYGTPQDTNTVGQMNSCYSKLYFKDA